MRDLTIYKLLGEGVSWIIGDLPENAQPYRTDIFPDKYKKQNPLEPSSTIVAHLYKDGNMFIHPREARTITAREAARLQSFKDTFVFPVARTYAFKQIGNASMFANSLNKTALPSITGIEASAPIFPRPKTAVPLDITATVLPFVVYL